MFIKVKSESCFPVHFYGSASPQQLPSGGLQIKCRLKALMHFLNLSDLEATSMFYSVYGSNVYLKVRDNHSQNC